MEDASEETRKESTFFFPLRANAGYFDSPNDSLPLIERVKQASLVYDRLVFEEGEYSAFVTERGIFEVRQHASESDSATFVDHQAFDPTGGEASVEFSTDGAEFFPFLSGSVIRRFQSEFHSSLRVLGAEEAPWIELSMPDLTDRSKVLAQHIKQQIQAS